MFSLPWIVTLLTAAAALAAVRAWLEGWRGPIRRVHYTLVVVGCGGFVALTAAFGLLG